jgi:hypothetical protein
MGNAIPISARDLRPKSVGPPESKQAMPSPCAQNDATRPSMLKATAGGSKKLKHFADARIGSCWF